MFIHTRQSRPVAPIDQRQAVLWVARGGCKDLDAHRLALVQARLQQVGDWVRVVERRSNALARVSWRGALDHGAVARGREGARAVGVGVPTRVAGCMRGR